MDQMRVRFTKDFAMSSIGINGKRACLTVVEFLMPKMRLNMECKYMMYGLITLQTFPVKAQIRGIGGPIYTVIALNKLLELNKLI